MDNLQVPHFPGSSTRSIHVRRIRYERLLFLCRDFRDKLDLRFRDNRLLGDLFLFTDDFLSLRLGECPEFDTRTAIGVAGLVSRNNAVDVFRLRRQARIIIAPPRSPMYRI